MIHADEGKADIQRFSKKAKMTLNKISIKPLLHRGKKFSAVRSGASSENFPECSIVSFEILFTVLTFSFFWVKPKGHAIIGY